jgi:Transcriptional antiterminator
MRELLSIHSIRQLALLEYLMRCSTATIAEISAATGYAPRTLWQDIQEVNGYLAPIRIETTNTGVMLNIPPSLSIRAIYRLLLAGSKEYNLLEYLFLNEGGSLEEVADNLYLSLSTLRRMIAEMNKKLEKHRIKIAVAPTKIIGDELSVSQFYIALFSEKYYNLSDFLQCGEFQTLNLLLNKICKENSWQLTFPDMQKLRLWGYVRLVRMRHNHPIHYTQTLDMLHDYSFLHDQAFLIQFFVTFRMKLDKELLMQMFQLVLGGLHLNTYEQLMFAIKKEPFRKKIFDNVYTLLSALSNEFDISLSNTENLQLDLYNIMQRSHYRHFIIYSRSRQFLEGFGKDYPYVLNIFYEKLQHLRVCHCMPEYFICDDMIYAIITQWPDFLEKIENIIPEIEVGLLFDTDIAHLRFIQKILKKHSTQKLSIAVPNVFATTVGQLPCQELDLLITDIPNLPVKDVEVLCVQEYPSEKDWKRILSTQERIVRQKMQALNNNFMKGAGHLSCNTSS